MIYFPHDSYETRPDTRRFLLDRLSFNSRAYFMLRFFDVVLRARSLALKGTYDTVDWARSSYEVFRIVEGRGGRFSMAGLSNLGSFDGPAVFIGNHMSTLETQVLPCIIAPVKEATFVVKESLVRHPFFGPIISARNPIVVGRKNPKEDLSTVLRKGQELLAAGTSVILFPQSGRFTEFDPKEFNSLGVKLARNAGVPVIPFALKTDFWANGRHLKDLGPIDRSKRIYFEFGQAMEIHGTGKEENEAIIHFIQSRLAAWASLSL